MDAILAFNTAISFITNTDWQAYGGETTLSNLSRMAAITFPMFASATTGFVVAMAFIRAFTIACENLESVAGFFKSFGHRFNCGRTKGCLARALRSRLVKAHTTSSTRTRFGNITL